MDQMLESLQAILPCRDDQIQKLCHLFFNKEEPYLDNVFIYGAAATGKSITVTTVLEKLHVRHVTVNLMECYTSKILFETILNDLYNYEIDPENPTPVEKCDTVMDFIKYLQNDFSKKCQSNFVVILDKAEELQNMNFNLLGIFLKLRELTGLPVTVLLISEIIFENFSHHTVIPFKISFPQYTRNELMKILMLDEKNTRKIVNNHYNKEIYTDPDFYENYLNLFLSMFYRTTRHLSELKHISRINFLKYCEPISKGTHTNEDSLGLWKNISPILKSSLESLHLMVETEKVPNPKTRSQDMVAILELPFYAKYLLVAAYLASYNSTKEDKRLFVKFQGSKQKRKTQTKIQRNLVKQLNVQLGPSPFTFDRLLAIFYALLDQKVGFNNNLLVQVSSLVELKFLLTVSDSSTIDSQKYKCNLSFDSIQEISRMLGINIRKYLYDF